MPNLSFKIRPNIIQGSNLSDQGTSDSNVYIEYNNVYPPKNVSRYRIEANLALTNVKVNEDLSIDFDFEGIETVRAYTTFSSQPVGYNITKTLYRADNSVAWTETSDIATAFDSGYVNVTKSDKVHYHVPANGSINVPELKAFRWYCTGVIPDECEVYVGGTVTNIIPTYIPNGIFKGSWKAVQQLALSNFILRNSWVDVGSEEIVYIGKENTGHTRRYQNGSWKQEGIF